MSGTVITNGLDALRGLASFLGLRPYDDPAWWAGNIVLSADAGPAAQARRLAHLRAFADAHMWRSRQCDVKSMPAQVHLPPTMVSASQV